MLFPIKQFIKKPETTAEGKEEKKESKKEEMIEEYLNDTYNLTRILNKQEESKKNFEWNKRKK